MDDWTPEPQTFGWLEPPRKLPPTAVGVATPPPPHRPRRRSRRLPAQGPGLAFMLGMATGAGILAGIGLPLTSLLEIGAGLTALEVASLVLRRNRASSRLSALG